MKKFYPIALLLSLSLTTSAAIVYTDVSPDQTINNNTYMLDINNDGISDFSFSALGNSLLGWLRCDFGVDTLNSILIDSQGNPYASSLSNGVSISPSGPGHWHQLSGSTSILLYVTGISGAGGNFTGINDHYIGLKFHVGNNFHYGWMRVSVNTSNMSFTVKDYAYDTTPNAAIVSGATVTGVLSQKNNINTSIVYYAQEQQIKISSFAFINQIATVNIYDASGKYVTGTAPIFVNSTDNDMYINTHGFSVGLYIIEMQFGNFSENKKLFIH